MGFGMNCFKGGAGITGDRSPFAIRVIRTGLYRDLCSAKNLTHSLRA